MKRILNLLIIALLVASVGGTASAAQRRKSSSKPQTTKEVTLTSESKAIPAPEVPREKKQASADPTPPVVAKPGPSPHGNPHESELKKAAGSGRKFDLRKLPRIPPAARDRNELEPPPHTPALIGPPQLDTGNGVEPAEPRSVLSLRPAPNAPAPPPNGVFDGLDRFNWGAGSPPDTNGDVGPNNYIQTVNTSIGVFRKSDGFMQAAFTFDTFMSQGSFGNLCDTNNFGDPVVLYDTFEDRWIITDFAFQTDISGNVIAPAYQCVAASLSGDPIAGGWNFYSIQISDNLNDYPKFGIWPDGLYMSANLFSFGAGSAFKGARVWAFNKAQMYAGSPTVKIVSFDVGGGDFTIIPSNARLQAGTPPLGRPNLFVSTWQFLNALTVYKFHVDWNDISLSTFTGPDVPLAATSWPNAGVANIPQSGTAQLLDALQIRAMVQNQYTNYGGVESLWVPHTVRRANTSGFAAPRWYQVDVTGGTVGANLPQATTWDPDGANVMHRWMPSLALDRAGNMAMGYSTSSSSTFPSIKYAGRLVADPLNTFSLGEQTFFAGTASQLSSTRWGDYSSMTLDPDGCTFWYTNEYATGLDNTTVDPTSFNKRWQTKFGSFGPLPGCTPVGAGGTVSGVVTRLSDATPIAGATVALGARSATTDGSGVYSFTNIPAGTYPSMTASFAGYNSSGASNIAVTDGGTTTQNFALANAPASACLTDTTQGDFLTGVLSNVDLNASPGDVELSNAPTIDQQNTAGTSTGTGFGTPNWTGQTFIAGVTGQLVKADVQLFCSGCGATPPNLTLSVRATSTGLPTGADLATATIPGSTFASGASVTYTATFGSPASLTSGTQYALVLRPVSAPAGSGYFWIRSSPSTYANGSRVLSADGGTTWSADTTRDFNFKTYMQTGYKPSGTLVSSPKDANPATAITPIWSTLSWNATLPANTSVKFQVAGSNNSGGPFNFVGPDGTAATFFTTSPVQLSPQFYNLRYLEYEAFLGTTDATQTPVLNDVTLCFNDVNCSSIVANPGAPPAVCTNSTGNTASGPAGMTSYAWGIANGTITSATNTQTITYTAGASGTITLTLTVTAPNGCIVSGSTPVTIDVPATPTITPGGPTTFTYPGNVVLTSSAASGNQWSLGGVQIGGATNQTYTAAASGNYTVTVTDGVGCVSPTSAITSVTVNPATPTVTATGGTFTYNGNPQGGSCSATGGAGETLTCTLTFTGTGSTTYGPSATAPSLAGTYSAVAHTNGDANNTAADSSPAALTINKFNPLMAAHGGTFTYNGAPEAGTGQAIGGAGENLPVTLSYQGISGTTYGPTATPPTNAGIYLVTAHTVGDANNNAEDSLPNALRINKANPVMAANTGPFTYNGTPQGGGSATGGGGETLTVTLTFNGTGSTTYGPSATAPSLAGTYTVTVHTDGDANNTAGDLAATAFTINKFNPLMAAHGGTFTYNAAPEVGTGQAIGGAGENLPVTLSYLGISGTTYGPTATPPTNAGVYLVTAHTVGDANNNAEDSLPNALRINKATATISVTAYCVVFDGAAHTAAGTATGVVSETLPGLVLTGTTHTAAGTYVGDAWTFSDPNYNGANGTVDDSIVNAAISASATVPVGSTGNVASVANAGTGATYAWSITNGTITAGTGTNSITFSAGAVGNLTLQVTVTTSTSCASTKSANVFVGTPVTVTSVAPATGSTFGGFPVTINGSGFQSGAAVTFGSSAATNVVVVSATKITAKTPAHAVGSVNVTVTNTDTSTGTLTNGYTYVPQRFDPNNDGTIDPSDIFYLVNYLFLGGPAPAGPAGVLSGDANGDGVVDPSDIFFIVNYLFDGGARPTDAPPASARNAVQPLRGALTLGEPFTRNGRTVVPLLLATPEGADTPQSLSLNLRFSRNVVVESVHRAGATAGAQPAFEISRSSARTLTYLVSYRGLSLRQPAVVAEIELSIAGRDTVALEIDPELTLLGDADGGRAATVANGHLQVTGTTIESRQPLAPRDGVN